MADQPEALRLADALEDDLSELGVWGQDIADSAAAELRRLHSANEGQTRLNTSLVLENSQLLREKLELLKAFAALPRREWVEITNEDIINAVSKHKGYFAWLEQDEFALIKAVIQAVKEKNGYE